MKLIKEIKSKKGVVHFKRWRVFSTPWFDVNIHGIYESDKDKHLHNHPWWIFTIVLWGGYREGSGGSYVDRGFLHPSYSSTDKYHIIETMKRVPTYTLAIMGKPKSDWGYRVKGKHVQHDVYRKLKREGKI